MKRTAIGAVFLCTGFLDMLALIITAAVSLPSFTSWDMSYPSKLWFLIFAGRSQFNNGPNGLGLGLMFVLGILLALAGLVVLCLELAKKDK